MDISAWLRELGLERYADAFEASAIDHEVLADLTEADLEKLGVLLGHRKKLLRAMADLAERIDATAPPFEPGTKQTDRATGAERRQLTVIFVDLVGSTELSARLDPEDMGRVIRAYQECCATVVERWDGHVAKYMGDGVLAYFGWPRAHEDDAERALRAGLDLTEAVSDLAAPDGQTLAARVGIATGLVMVGELVGDGAAKEQAVVGETPNLAARLQALADPGCVVVAPSTRRLVGGLFDFADLGEHDLKGFAEAVRAWRVVGESQVESRFEARQSAELAPIVGRKHELALLLDRWARAVAGEGQVIVLSGEAGIGKSRIARSLIEALTETPHTRLRYQCSPHHTNSAFHPIIQRLERAAGFQHDDSSEAKLDKLETLLASERLGDTMPVFAALLSLPNDQRYQRLNLSPERQKQRILEALTDNIEVLATHQPILILCEDAHWIDPSTQEVFDLLVERVQRLAILMLVTFRPEHAPPWTGHAHVTQLSLNRLSKREGAEIVGRITGGRRLPDEVMEPILVKADGVPLFIEELTKTVLESGLLSDAGDRYELSGPSVHLAIPATLQDSLMARLDRLAPVKEVAQVASVIGREFSLEVLVAVADQPEPDLDAALDRLAAAELIFRRGGPAEVTYSFKHALVRDAAYQSLLRSRRRQLHARIAEVLEERFSDVAAHQPEIVAQHFAEAGVLDRAVAYWQRAGERANERAANAEAVEHLQSGLAALADLPDTDQRRQQELELLTTLGRVLNAAKGFGVEEVATIYNRARALYDEVTETAKTFPVLLGLAINCAVRAELDTAQRISERLLEFADETNDPVLLVEAHYALGITHSWRGDFLGAWRHLESGIGFYEVDQHRDHLSLYGQDGGPICLCRGAMARWYIGHLDHAKALMNEALDVCETLGHLFTRAYVLTWSMCHDVHRREIAAAEKGAVAAETFAIEHEFPFWHTQVTFLQGWVMAQRGEPQIGLDRMCKGLAGIRTLGTTVTQPWALGLIGETLGKIGRASEGLERIAEALEIVDGTGACWFEAELHRHKAELLLASENDQSGAEAMFCRSIEVARHQSAKSWELRSATSLARLWADAGKRAQAHDLLAPIYGWFTEGFDTADLRDARALLDELV